MTKTLKSIFALSCASIAISYAADGVTTWCHNPYDSKKPFVVISGDQSFSPYKKSQDENSRSGSTHSNPDAYGSSEGHSPVSVDGMPPAYYDAGHLYFEFPSVKEVPLPSYRKKK